MKPDNPQLIDRLAAEYVLGTLRGRARRRFERWRVNSQLVDRHCREWEERLVYLAKDLRPMAPGPRVWTGISTRIGAAPQRRRSVRWLPLAASFLLVAALAALLTWRSLVPLGPSSQATIAVTNGPTVWQVEIFEKSGRLQVRTVSLPPSAPGRAYELWALPPRGAPVSLGLLPLTGAVRRDLSGVQRQALAGAMQVAVSVEPPGGSPTGAPTGAVVFVAALRTLS